MVVVEAEAEVEVVAAAVAAVVVLVVMVLAAAKVGSLTEVGVRLTGMMEIRLAEGPVVSLENPGQAAQSTLVGPRSLYRLEVEAVVSPLLFHLASHSLEEHKVVEHEIKYTAQRKLFRFVQHRFVDLLISIQAIWKWISWYFGTRCRRS